MKQLIAVLAASTALAGCAANQVEVAPPPPVEAPTAPPAEAPAESPQNI